MESELARLECGDKPIILFLNKTDLINDDSIINKIKMRYPEAIFGSVHNGEGLEMLKERLLYFYETVYLRKYHSSDVEIEKNTLY